jgi:hypothetical protein
MDLQRAERDIVARTGSLIFHRNALLRVPELNGPRTSARSIEKISSLPNVFKGQTVLAANPASFAHSQNANPIDACLREF